MATIPYLSQGLGVEVDPLTGLPRKKKQQQQQAPGTVSMQGGFGAFPGKAADNLAGGAYGGGGVPGGQPYTIPGFTPDYQALINNDPLFSQARSDFAAQGVQDAASRASQTQRALALFGQVPDFNQLTGLNQEYLNADVTPEARMLAQRNTEAGMSVVARQDKAFKDQIRQIKNALASRGALRSGEAGHQFKEAQLDRDQASFDTTSALTEFLSGLQAGFAERQRQIAREKAQAAETAMGRVTQQYPATGPQTVYPEQPGQAPPLAPAAALAPKAPDIFDAERGRGRGARIAEDPFADATSAALAAFLRGFKK